jgi:surface polysaccharide O-acyltransferase-like enzyme
MNRNQFVKSVLIGAYVSVIFVVIITIAGELYKVTGVDIKTFLKNLHGHHWVGKGIWAVALFLLTSGASYLVNRGKTEDTTSRHVSVLAWTLALGTITLFAFFGYEYAIH